MFEMKCETPAHEISVQTYRKSLEKTNKKGQMSS